MRIWNLCRPLALGPVAALWIRALVVVPPVLSSLFFVRSILSFFRPSIQWLCKCGQKKPQKKRHNAQKPFPPPFYFTFFFSTLQNYMENPLNFSRFRISINLATTCLRIIVMIGRTFKMNFRLLVGVQSEILRVNE